MNKQPEKALSYLGLSMRAGKLVTGDEAVMKAVRSGEARLIIVAADASANTKKKIGDKCRSYKVLLIEGFDREQLGRSIGKEQRVVVAVTDDGFAQLIRKSMGNLAEVEGIE